MGTRLTVFDQKGGAGKTTMVLNLAGGLALRRDAAPGADVLEELLSSGFLEA